MTEHILVVHGMNKGKQNEALQHFLEQILSRNIHDYHIAFLESTKQSLEQVLDTRIQQGAESFNIIPLLLFPAKHYIEDIPMILKVYEYRYPHIKYKIAEPLGTHKLMTKLVKQNIFFKVKSHPKIQHIILMAHGSERYRHPDIALWQLTQDCDVFEIPISMMTLYGYYNYRFNLQHYLKNNTDILIVPIFFYDGFLVNKAKHHIAQMNDDCNIHYASAINFDPLLSTMITERIKQLEVFESVSNSTQLVR
ncbi:sirohydrochlorin chelatase [Staphylococcus equorum]|uniref:Sirohydrochlorin chelatase n=1 Tax=Staphylococcus equorum TaxID=246432 RepID=A0A9X4LAI4_9STAP|nr:sirohydrochlorin chelatase [Staphylococcus equorum]MDG0844056.1 sirohydrochlorin chelatase [Staphylococcus equorum]MDG0859985.1 sirohydrochlorin chelatase [Staphylococcus equorum]